MLNYYSIPVCFSVSSVLHCLEFCGGLGSLPPFSSLQEQVIHILWPVCCARVRRPTLHEGKAEAELTPTFGIVVAEPRHFQVSPTCSVVN